LLLFYVKKQTFERLFNMLILVLLKLAAGILALAWGATWLVNGASALAQRLKVPSLIIGLTVVAAGTSLPELIVNLTAALNGHTEIAIGNILGSNIANILLILGLSAIVCKLPVQKKTIWGDLPYSLLVTLVLLLLAADSWVNHRMISQVSRIDGLILLLLFGVFLYYTFFTDQKKNQEKDVEYPTVHSHRPVVSLLMICGGLALLAIGSHLLVNSALIIAALIGLSESVVGLTVVAIGTSLPELITSIVAVAKNKSDIAIGNVVGSNIFNIVLILGATAVIKPLPVPPTFLIDIGVAIGSTLLLWLYIRSGKPDTLDRWQGLSFVAIYGLYLASLILRG
jgi:cation:H+ antiporter